MDELGYESQVRHMTWGEQGTKEKFEMEKERVEKTMEELRANFERNMKDLEAERKVWEEAARKAEEEGYVEKTSMNQGNLDAYLWNARFQNDSFDDFHYEF